MITLEIIPWVAEKTGFPIKIDEANNHVATAAFIAILLTVSSLIAWRRLRKTEERIVPSGGLHIAAIFEILVEAILHLMEDIMGPKARKHLPLIGTLFIYILSCNLIGVVPGFAPPTDNISTNFACAICVFLYYNYIGIREHGLFKYFKHMAGPVIWLAPLMITIELASHLVRPISLSVRLFGNMMGDHLVLGMFSNLVPLIVPIAFMVLTIFVAFLQAFVFSILSIVYITLASEAKGH